MTTKIEEYIPQGKIWRTLGEIKPGDQPGSFSNTLRDGKREIIVFGPIRADSKSMIFRLRRSLDVENGSDRILMPDPDDVEIIKELSSGESLEMDLKTDSSSSLRRIRFSHIS